MRRDRYTAVDAARQVAFDVLRAVDEEDAYANLVLPRLLRQRRVSGRDAAFATELAYGVLRGRGTYDAVLAARLDRPPADLDAPVRDVLRLGAHQLLGMRVPDHAAVATSVALARVAVGAGAAGLVNAVLRGLAGRDLDSWLDEVVPAGAA
ncbi:transcription antitermination factor NusB, partial [Kineococcus glutinatus]|uniref:transcription antitermination factor NusB n=1 Tax=Kineococcus glutinatus TaxID=1070872 RepID=UPI0031E75B60